jgi:hypothetical protein
MDPYGYDVRPHPKGLRDYVLIYLIEFLEFFIALSTFSLIVKPDQDNNIINIIKFSFIFSFISVWLEDYDPRYRVSLRAGFIASIGSSVVSRV